MKDPLDDFGEVLDRHFPETMRTIEELRAAADPNRPRIWRCIYHDHDVPRDRPVRCSCEGESWGGGTLMTRNEARDEAELHLGHDCGDGTWVTDYHLDLAESTMHFICVR